MPSGTPERLFVSSGLATRSRARKVSRPHCAHSGEGERPVMPHSAQQNCSSTPGITPAAVESRPDEDPVAGHAVRGRVVKRRLDQHGRGAAGRAADRPPSNRTNEAPLPQHCPRPPVRATTSQMFTAVKVSGLQPASGRQDRRCRVGSQGIGSTTPNSLTTVTVSESCALLPLSPPPVAHVTEKSHLRRAVTSNRT